MQIGTLGKRRYAFGLSWLDPQDSKPQEIVRESLEGAPRAVYTVVTNADKQSVVGFAPTTSPLKGSVYSYAAALATLGQDAVYAAPMDDQLWYVAISDGLVVAGTDQILPTDAALNAITNMRTMFGLPLIVVEGLDIPVQADSTFDPDRVVARAKSGKLKVLGSGNVEVGKLAVVLVGVAVLGYFGWQKFIRKEAEVGLDAQAQAEQVRANYLNEIRRTVQATPVDPAWVTRAFELSSGTFPDWIAGWRLDGVSCVPASCTAIYSLPNGAPFAVSPLMDLFGPGAVTVLNDQRSLQATLMLTPPQMATWPDEVLLAPPPASSRAMDAVGLVPLSFFGVMVEGPVKTINLSGAVQQPPEARPVYSDTVAVKQSDVLESQRLQGLASYFADAGFVASNLNFSNGYGAAPRAWRIEWTRVHGGEGI